MNYWQVAAGADSRDYSQSFLRYGLAFVGANKDKQLDTMWKVELGDVLVLKLGNSKIQAAGKVIEQDGKAVGFEDKEWLRDFDGWDLPAYCHVEWHVPPDPIVTKGLGIGAIQRLNQPEPQRIADRILQEEPRFPSYPEPPPVRRIEDQEILNFLVREGLRPSASEELTTTLNRIRLLAQYYYNELYYYQEVRGEDIREYETRSFLILPLLLALGWSEQQIKIELGIKKDKLLGTKGGRIDIACFARAYRRNSRGESNDGDCTLIIETKDFQSGLDKAPDQAKVYAEKFPSCQVVLVSNGYCYKAYKRDSDTGQFQQEPSAYINLLRPHDRYPLNPNHVDGALEVLRLMLPQSWR